MKNQEELNYSQTGLIALKVVATVSNVNLDLKAIVKEFGIDSEELSPKELIKIAKRKGFKAKLKKFDIKKIDGYPLPLIVILNDGTYANIIKYDTQEQRIMLYFPKTDKSEIIGIDELAKINSNKFIVLGHKMISDDAKFGFGWFFSEIKKYKHIIFQVLLASFVVQLFGLVTPLFTQVILDKVLVHRSLSTLDVLAVAFVAIALFEMMLNYARNHVFIHTAKKLDAKLGSKLFDHMLSLPYSYFEGKKVGNIISRVRELDTIREFITNKVVSVIIDLIFSSVFLVVMIMYSLKLTMIVLGIVFLISLIYLIITPELRKRLEKSFQTGAASNAYLVESLTGIETLKSLSIEGSMKKRWDNYLSQYVQAGFRLATLSNTSGTLTATLQKLMTISILYVGVSLVINNQLSVGQLIAFQMFAGQFTAPILRLVNLWNEFQQVLLSVDKIGDILNTPVEQDSDKSITLDNLGGSLRIENLSFKYTPDGQNILNNVNFTIGANNRVGIVGKSGSGKSTFTKLIQKLFAINQGAIYIDGVDIKHMNALWLRSNIGVVLQENYLFSGTIKDNISLSKPTATMDEIIEASRLAGADEFIARLSDGYDTVVEERGSNLSGGQRQRIAIARALLTQPKILIFDEATSALDNDSQKIIETNLKDIAQNRTMIIISHRLSIVKDSDYIIALDEGEIVEQGSWDELMAQKGYLHHLNELENS